jgi:polar amino acid transport system substrate-binding protein
MKKSKQIRMGTTAKTRILALTLTLAWVFALAACSGAGTAGTTPTTAGTTGAAATAAATEAVTTEAGATEAATAAAPAAGGAGGKTLRVGTSADYPPYEFHQVSGGKDNIVGFEMETIRYIGRELGYEVEIVDMEFDSILAAVNSGTVDCGIAAMSINDERKGAVDFTDYYYVGEQLMLIRAADQEKYVDFSDLSGTPCAIQNGTIHEGLAIENIPGVVIKPYKTVADMAMELQNSMVESACLDAYVAKAYAAKYPALLVPTEMTFPTSEEDSYAIVVKKGDTALLDELNQGIQALKDSDQMAEWIETANRQMMEESAA